MSNSNSTNAYAAYTAARDRLRAAQRAYEEECQRIAEGLMARNAALSPLVVEFVAEEWNEYDYAMENPRNSGEWPLSMADAAEILDRRVDDLAALTAEEWEDTAEEMNDNNNDDYDDIRETETSPVPAECLQHTGPFTVGFRYDG